MAALGIAYEVGDAVFVAYPFPSALAFDPQARTVTSIDVVGTGDEAEVRFSNGDTVKDSTAAQTIYLTAALAATAIVDDVIVKIDASVNLDATTTVGSTAAQTSLSLGRVDS